MNKSETIAKLALAMTKAQSQMTGASRSASNPFFKSKYANLEEVINTIKVPFAEVGLSFLQFPITSDGHAGVETIILHESGEFISNEFLLKCSKNDPQGMGSAITYARRYGLQSATGLASEDDDGNAASAPMTQTEAKEKLGQSINTESLLAEFKKLPIELQKAPDILDFCKTKKAELTPKTTKTTEESK